MCATVKKGKFKVSSYEINEKVIYFPSINKVKKIIAFSILEVSDFSNILSILKDLLEERIIDYFTVQISISKSIDRHIILCFVNSDLNKVLESLDSIKKKLTDKNCNFLKKKHLEQEFFKIGFSSLNSRIHKIKSTNSIIIENERDFNLIDTYTFDLSELENRVNFLYNFTNLINKFNKQGFLILIFQFESDLVVTSGHFIELQNDIKNEFNLEIEINNFFEYDIIKLFDLEVNDIYRVLWRLNLSKDYLLFKDMEEILISGDKKNELDIAQINMDFEISLEENGIVFHRLNTSMILIEKKVMFLIMKEIDFQLISKVFSEIYPKYSLNILIIDNSQYFEMIKVKKIAELPNVRIFDYESFSRFNVNEFKT